MFPSQIPCEVVFGMHADRSDPGKYFELSSIVETVAYPRKRTKRLPLFARKRIHTAKLREPNTPLYSQRSVGHESYLLFANYFCIT